MRKSLLAMAALMGISTLPAHAWRVNIDKETYADIGFSTQIWGRNEGKRTDASTDHNATNFYVNQANITASGQVNKLVYFSINAEAVNPGFRQSFIVRDAFIGMKFAEEFRVQAGAMRVPFSRIALTSSYNYLIPTQAYGGTVTVQLAQLNANIRMPDNVYRGLSINPTDALGMLGDGSRDAGIVVWGNVAGGMLKYYLGVSDGRFDRRGEFFSFIENTNRNRVNVTKDSLAYTIRLQFTPTMLGFKPETGYTLSDTYLGRQNVLTLGVGYRSVKAESLSFVDLAILAGNILPLNFSYSKNAKLFTVDMLYEQKFGDLVPNLQVGYINAKDVPYAAYRNPGAGAQPFLIEYGKATQVYAQGQLLYDQVVGFGKPAIAIRWEQNKNKDLSQFDTNTGTTIVYTDQPKNTRLGVFVHYYIKGQAAKVSFGVDSVSRNTDSKINDPNTVGANGKSFTDFTLHLQTQF
jgi:hypothetical protein